VVNLALGEQVAAHLKIAFLCPSISRTSGGIFEIERKLAHGLARLPVTTLEIFGPSDKYTEEDLPAWSPLKPRHFSYRGPSSFRYSAGLRRALLTTDIDLVHMHALWMHNSIVLREWAQRWKRPYIVTANGMLEQWAVRNSSWKKRIALAFYERNCLNGAACIQVNSEAEYQSVRRFGLRNPVCVVPNGTDLPERVGRIEEDPEPGTLWNGLIPPGRSVLLYLGRLHPKKGLLNLIKAWKHATAAKGPSSSWVLAIAGWDQNGHQAELKNLASELQLHSSVAFLGPQFGEAKSECYRNCDAFILPSFSEGLPMVILEAWSHGKPVLMTRECNLTDGFCADAALRVEPSVNSIEDGLRTLFAMPTGARDAMGQRGLTLVKNKFTWAKIAVDMRSVYAWILGRGPRPECVVD
jgi:glycosyltransferase involved in cell wall biosynthesis